MEEKTNQIKIGDVLIVYDTIYNLPVYLMRVASEKLDWGAHTVKSEWLKIYDYDYKSLSPEEFGNHHQELAMGNWEIWL